MAFKQKEFQNEFKERDLDKRNFKRVLMKGLFKGVSKEFNKRNLDKRILSKVLIQKGKDYYNWNFW